MHQPLSQKLAQIVQHHDGPEGTTLNQLMERTEGRGFYLVIILLALPFPPLPPFTNSLPTYSLILVAVSTMEEDGVMIWAGYAGTIASTIYLFFVAEGLQFIFVKAYHWFQHS